MRLGLIEERGRLNQASLASPQLRQSHQCFARHRRAAGREFISGRDQLLLGFEPRAAPQANRRILRPAHGEEWTQAPLRTKNLESRTPLDGTLIIAHALTR